MLLIQRIAFVQLIPIALCTAGSQSVILNCSVHFERKYSLFNITQWARCQSIGENMDKDPIYIGLLKKADQAAFGNERICSKLFGLTERDTDTYYCNIGNRHSVGKNNTVGIKCRMKETRFDITPILLGALALITVLIVFLTVRLMRVETNSSDIQATRQALPRYRVAEEESLHYAQLNIQQAGRKDRVNRNVADIEYASINSLSSCMSHKTRRPELTYANSGDLRRQDQF